MQIQTTTSTQKSIQKQSKGYIHLYTGNGKGKTTAAIGLSVRAACAGFNVYIGQFVKGMEYSEVKISQFLPNITIEQYGQDCFIEKAPTDEDVDLANCGLDKIKEVLTSGEYDMVVLDEVTIALYFKLFTIEELLDVLKMRNENIEVVMTGRYADEKLIEFSDLVTEMKEIKHYYNVGVEAREGIER